MDENCVKLEPESELQISVGEHSENVGLKLVEGEAQIFGGEMEINKIYIFPPFTSVSALTWRGCSIEVIGTPEIQHVASNTLIMLHVGLHAELEQMRQGAEKQDTRGPVVLVVGPTDSGKSSLCRVLLNYAVAHGRRPFYVDLDVGQNSLSIPGTINVLSVQKYADIVDGFDQDSIQVYQFGYKSPGHFIALYFLLIKKIGKFLKSYFRNTTNKNALHSGVIINSCGWTRGQGYNALTLAALSFKIDKLVVLEDGNLYKQLKRDMPSCVEVKYLPKMDGVVERSRTSRYQSRERRIKEYFYGATIPLKPFTFEVSFADVKIYKVIAANDEFNQDASVNVTLDDISYTSVPWGDHLVNQIFALSSTDEISQTTVLTNCIGFICITGIDMQKEVITVLSPQAGPLPNKILIMGDIELKNIQ